MFADSHHDAASVRYTKTLPDWRIIGGLKAIRPDQFHGGDLVLSCDRGERFATGDHMDCNMIASVSDHDVDCGRKFKCAVVKEDRPVCGGRSNSSIRSLRHNFGGAHREGALRCDITNKHAV